MKRNNFHVFLRGISLPTLVTTFLYWTSENPLTNSQVFCAWLLLCIPWHSFCTWRETNTKRLPLFSMLSFIHWLYFVLPLFWGNLVSLGIEERPLEQTSVTNTMIMVVIGIAMIWIGMRSNIGKVLTPRKIPDVSLKQSGRTYIRILLVVGVIGGFWESAPYALGEGGRQILIILTTLVPSVAFAILFRLYLRGESHRVDRLLLMVFFLVRAVVGLSSGWLGTLVGVVIICIAIYIVEVRRLPRWILAVTLIYVAFFQVGKGAMRSKYWYSEQQGGQVEKVIFWFDASVERWGEALNDDSGKELKSIGYQVLSRTSLLPQAANVLELTPSKVPYQYGRLYSYLPITLIPRFVWPEKPSVNEANQFYQVNYNLTAEENLKNVSISVGYLTESYISFGWLGVIFIMFLFGVFYDFLESCFLSESSGLLSQSIGVSLLFPLLGIESQLAVYIGGLVQQVLLTFLVFSPIFTTTRESSTTGWASAKSV